MIQQFVTTPTITLLEQTLNFTEQRHNVLLEDIANVSTPGFVQKDVSVKEFQKSLQDAVTRRRASYNNEYQPESNSAVEFQEGGSRVQVKPQETVNSVAFHDRGVRSMEYLMSEMGDNAMAHNTVVQLLRGRYDTLNKAITMKP